MRIQVSFGSLWWSTEPEKIWAALDVLMERKIPFVSLTMPTFSYYAEFVHKIFAHASPFASVPDEVIDKIKSCGFGYESTWIPQTEVLHHKVNIYALLQFLQMMNCYYR